MSGSGSSAPSFWLAAATADGCRTLRDPLPGDTSADVAIVGAGFSGLWTALYLAEADPALRIVVLEARHAGFGASGRNGGWCSALLPMSWERIAARSGRDATVALQHAMFATVDEVIARAAALGIDCDAHKGGWLHHATHPAHTARLHAHLAHARSWGFGEDDFCWLDRNEAAARLAARGTLGAMFTPHCAVLQPARLVLGLADAVVRAGVRLYEDTRATSIEPGRVRTPCGTVRADVVLRTTEAYTARLPGLRRAVAPLYSLMVVTEPLPASFWHEVGWHDREAFSDARNTVIYGQRTADGRIAFGGRGAPYHYASRIDPAFDHDRRVHERLLPATLRALFPGDLPIADTWGGPLAAPRDWTCSVGFDRVSGIGWAGGYVGDGVSTSHLAGRILADLVVGHDTPRTHLPIVGHRSRRWEPEPLRWLGINTGLYLTEAADRFEERHGRPSRLHQRALRALLGRD